MIIGICDDEEKCRDILIEYCDRIEADMEEKFEYIQFGSGEEVLAAEEELEILLMDIEMDGINGIDTMKKLDNYSNIKNIIFVSGYPEKVFEAFGLKTRAFIQKPVDYNKLAEEIKKIADRQRKREIIEITSLNRQVYYIEAESIVYISGEKDQSRIFTENAEYYADGSIKYWEEKLSKHNIVRVHKSYLVNLRFVSRLDECVTFTVDKDKITVGRKYREESREVFRSYRMNRLKEERW